MTKYNFDLPEHNYNSERFDIEYPELEDIKYSYTEYNLPKTYRPDGIMNKESLNSGKYILCSDPT